MQLAKQPASFTLNEFWDAADLSQTLLIYKTDDKLGFLRTASVDALRRVLIEYRYFTINYIADLAMLVHRLPFGNLRSLMAEVLAEELGEGQAHLAHTSLYDDFLFSVGVSKRQVDAPPLAKSFDVLAKISERMATVSVAHAVGLRGMGGECLCQVYLTALHWNMLQNPYIQANSEKIDWRFWEIHTGEHDIQHREKTRTTINELALMKPEWISDLRSGYEESKVAWDQFWQHVYNNARSQ